VSSILGLEKDFINVNLNPEDEKAKHPFLETNFKPPGQGLAFLFPL
jgi:hypothetical protein